MSDRKIRGLVPPRTDDAGEETPALRETPGRELRITTAPAAPWVRPRHDKMNFYPTRAAKEEFVTMVDDLVRQAGRVDGRKLNDGLVHDAVLRFAMANWEHIRAQFIQE